MQIFQQVDFFRKKIQKTPEKMREVYVKKIATPKLLHTLIPISALVKRSNGFTKLKQECCETTECKEIPNENIGATSLKIQEGCEATELPSFDSGVIRVVSETNFSNSSIKTFPNNKEDWKTSTSQVVFCECGKEMTSFESSCSECEKRRSPMELSGFLYIKKNQTQLERYWFYLLNKELYCKKFFSIIIRLQKQS